jgi:hypothetical protein
MNHDQLIKGTNKVALYATIALFYWVFTFLVITAFDLKVFREHMTDIFYLSILGIFAILGGAIVLNVMSNLSKISTVLSQERGYPISSTKPSKLLITAIVLSFPLICAVLFAGNHLSAEKKKNMLISSAQSLISENQAVLASLADYHFSFDYVKKVDRTLEVIRKIDKNFPEVLLILPDSIDGKKVFLGFDGSLYRERVKPIEKSMFIYSATREDRAYLEKVFLGNETKYNFSSRKGHYQLYFPAVIKGKKIVLYFSDYQEYGKVGS